MDLNKKELIKEMNCGSILHLPSYYLSYQVARNLIQHLSEFIQGKAEAGGNKFNFCPNCSRWDSLHWMMKGRLWMGKEVMIWGVTNKEVRGLTVASSRSSSKRGESRSHSRTGLLRGHPKILC